MSASAGETRTFQADRRSVPAARHFASVALAELPADVGDAVTLMVSELATNCVKHVGASFDVSILRSDDAVRVEVSDPSDAVPAMRSPGPDDPTGRGLRIVDMLSDSWGISRHGSRGKTVWFLVRFVTADAG